MFVCCNRLIDNRNSQFIISNVCCSLFDHDHSYLEGILLHLYWGTKSCSLNYLPIWNLLFAYVEVGCGSFPSIQSLYAY